MAEVLGQPAAERRRRTGSLGQLARVDRFVEADGPAQGARRLRLVNGGGIELEVHPDRCLDLGIATVGGLPVNWMSPAGITAPWAYEPAGTEWLRSFGGGLLATCGLDAFGPPSEVDGRSFGLHGRVGAQPAELVRCEANAEEVVVEGVVRQSTLFGENLVLRRQIRSDVGSDRFVLKDVVTNEGFVDAAHMILYHVNLGWPLLDEHAELSVPATSTVARDHDAELGIDTWAALAPPQPGWSEQVFRHGFEPDTSVSVGLRNPRRGLTVELQFSSQQLPWLYQWKMLGEGAYVLGLEPSNCQVVEGRAVAEDRGLLPMIPAGKSVEYELEFVLRRSWENYGVVPEAVPA